MSIFHMCKLNTVAHVSVQNHIFPTAEAHGLGNALKHLSKAFFFTKATHVHLRSQAVEGGRHRLSAELDESLTEDDAGADQSQATRHGGHHDGEDQRRRYLPLRRQSLRTCGGNRVN